MSMMLTMLLTSAAAPAAAILAFVAPPAPASLAFAAAPAPAFVAMAATPDEVVFKHGERILGKITQMIDGKITIESENMGVVKAPLDKVATFSTSEPIEIRFDDGTIIKQRVSKSDDG